MVEVDYGQLSLASQVLRRQGEVHATRMTEYVRAECSLSSFEMGVILRIFHPLNMVAVELGDRAFRVVRTLSCAAADAVDGTLDEYVEADRRAHDAFMRVMGQLGASGTQFTDPRTSAPQLGSADSVADSDFGAGEASAFEQAWNLPGDAGELVGGTLGDGAGRVRGWTGGSATVSERSDVSSFLVTPISQTSEMDNLRWSAGPLLGGVDWVFEQLFGFSLLEDVIMKPLAGNWEEIDKASLGWSHLGRGLMEMGTNYTGLPEMSLSWQGQAAEVFRAAMAAMGAAMIGLSYAMDYVSGLVGTVATAARLAALGIGAALNAISIKLLRIAAEAAVPIAGWVVAAIEGGILVSQIFGWLKKIYALINLIVDAVADFIDSREKLVQAIFAVEDLAEYLVRGGMRAVTS